MESLLQIRGARKAFGGQEVLRGVDLDIGEGCVTVLLGKSGTGKTVLLKAVAGLLPLDSGEVLFRGKPIDRRRGERPPMSYLFQGDALFDSLTARENVALPLREGRPLSTEEIASRVEPLLQKLDLEGIGEKYPSELSGGMRRRVALARALVVEPEIVLFDEPTAGLDPLRRNAVLELIHRDSHRFGFTALVVSHDVPESLFIADTAAILDEGVIAATGAPERLVEEMREDSALHGFLHNKGDLFERLNWAWPRERWEREEAKVRATHQTVAVLRFIEALDGLGLAEQLRHFRRRRRVMEVVRSLGPPVSATYVLGEQCLLVAFKGVAPAVAASMLFGVSDLVACGEGDGFFEIRLADADAGAGRREVQALEAGAERHFFRLPEVRESHVTS